VESQTRLIVSNQDFTSRILRSSAARLVATAMSLGIAFFMMPFVLGALGERNYGLWVLVASFESYCYFLDFGLNIAATRFVAVKMGADDHQGVNEAVSTAFVVFSVLGGVVAALTVAVAMMVPFMVAASDVSLVRTLLLLSGLSVAAGFPFHAFAGVVYGQMRHDLVEMTTVARRILEALFVYLALANGYGLIAYSCVLVVSNQVFSVVIYVIALRMWPSLQLRLKYFQRDLWMDYFRFSAWTTVSQLSDILRLKVDALVIAGFMGTTAVAHFNVGSRLTELSTTLIHRATNFMTPLYARYHAKGELSAIREKMADFTRVNSFLAFSAGAVLILVGDAFIRRWMGERFSDAYPVMVVLMLGRMVDAVSMPTSNVLHALSKVKFAAYANLAEALAKIALSLVLVQEMGIVGVAWGTTIPMVVFKLALVPLYTSRAIGMAPWQYYGSVLPSLAISFAILAVLHTGLQGALWQATYLRITMVATVALALLCALHILIVLNRDERRALAAAMVPQSR
jgi:O-antigen/teichoic acid export membrane protein